ncbi:hypothetical protein ACEWY4_011186 [Coilia grayii]|uniref:Peptidase M12B propeptide domain-containing protein n=1 Tax=Coilia grayii TaxID=363190 RepID=A0ABD1K439_9TELE
MCQLSALVRNSRTYQLHPKQESFIKQLSSYDIITPLRINDFGESFPHKLHYKRKRRSADEDFAGLRAHYRIDAFGQQFHLNLSADSGFIAPSYTVTHLGLEHRNDSSTDLSDDMRHCFFRGHVNSKTEFQAVFSLCTGLNWQRDNGNSVSSPRLGLVARKRAPLSETLRFNDRAHLPLMSSLRTDGTSKRRLSVKPIKSTRFITVLQSDASAYKSQGCTAQALFTVIGTFMTHSGEYFLEPLMQADGEEPEEEHNKPHLVYRHERKKSSSASGDPKPCAASGCHPGTCCFDCQSAVTGFEPANPALLCGHAGHEAARSPRVARPD